MLFACAGACLTTFSARILSAQTFTIAAQGNGGEHLGGATAQLPERVSAIMKDARGGAAIGVRNCIELHSFFKGMCTKVVRSFLGQPQGVLYIDRDRMHEYYGCDAADNGSGAMKLGPIVVSYSQYNTVLGTKFHPWSDNIINSPWKDKHGRIAAGMHRADVETTLGQAQAERVLLHKPAATGPAIAHEEVFYGPKPERVNNDRLDQRPVWLGPLRMLVGRDTRTVVTVECDPRQTGLSVQSWPKKRVQRSPLPMEVGWRERHAAIEKGMRRAEAEDLLGEATRLLHTERVGYGPPQRLSRFDSGLGAICKIEVLYGEKDEVIRAWYHRDRVGYEGDVDWR
jgi:hypothetical protein